MSRRATPSESGLSGRSAPLVAPGGGSASKFRGNKANLGSAPVVVNAFDLDQFTVDDDDVDVDGPAAAQAPAEPEPPQAAAPEPPVAAPPPPVVQPQPQPVAAPKATRASTRASAKAAPSAAAAAAPVAPSATLVAEDSMPRRGAAAARGSALAKGCASARLAPVMAPLVTQAAPAAAVQHAQDVAMEEEAVQEAVPPPQEAAPVATAAAQVHHHPRAAADAAQQQEQEEVEEDAVMEDATLPMEALAEEPAATAGDAAHMPSVGQVHVPAPAAAVAPALDAPTAAVAQEAPPARAPPRAVATPQSPSGGAMLPPAATPRRINSGAALSALALPHDSAERHSAGGVHEQAAAATMRVPPAVPSPSAAPPVSAAAASPRGAVQAQLPSRAAAEDMQLAVVPDPMPLALATAAGPSQQQPYDSGAVGQALATSMHVLQSLDQAQAAAARLYDEVRRQQVRTQMVINDALMLCSPAFGSVAANIKAALAEEMRKLDELPQAPEQENQQHGAGGGALT